MKLEKITVHPENERIYSPTDLEELEISLSSYGQMEPLAINPSHKIISGHRRFVAMRNLGWKECEVRVIDPDNEIIALIEHNRHRQKTTSDILNEARCLESQLKDVVGRGRNASNQRSGKKKGERVTMVMELSQRLGVGTSKLKQLLSISNYEPSLIDKIDSGEMSVSAAYELVRTKHIKSKNTKSPDSQFSFSFRRFLKDQKPTLDQLNKVLRETYPYSLELTGIDQDRRAQLIDHLERLRKLDSREMMLVQKQDELEHLEMSQKQLSGAKSLLPTLDELETFWDSDNPFEKISVLQANGGDLDKRLWNTIRICIHSQEHSEGPGRSMSAFVGFKNKNGFRLLGIFSFHSDSHTLQVRDDHIGWTTQQRAVKREHLVNMNVCCPSQPFGHNRLGGKFISLVATKLIPIWEKKYKTKIIGITTTSLHGSHSQYRGMRWWKHLGTSSGSVLMKPLEDEWSFWRQWLSTNYPDLYEQSTTASSPKQRMLSTIYRILDISQKDYYHNHRRGVFFCPLYTNYREFLTDKIKLGKLEPVEMDWSDWWTKKSSQRYDKLKQEQRLQQEPLFHESMNESDLQNWLASRGAT